MIRRVFVEKNKAYNVKAQQLKNELLDYLGAEYPELKNLKSIKVLIRYDVDLLDDEQFKQVCETVFSEPQADMVYYDQIPPIGKNDSIFGIEYLPGQYDQRSDEM